MVQVQQVLQILQEHDQPNVVQGDEEWEHVHGLEQDDVELDGEVLDDHAQQLNDVHEAHDDMVHGGKAFHDKEPHGGKEAHDDKEAHGGKAFRDGIQVHVDGKDLHEGMACDVVQAKDDGMAFHGGMAFHDDKLVRDGDKEVHGGREAHDGRGHDEVQVLVKVLDDLL